MVLWKNVFTKKVLACFGKGKKHVLKQSCRFWKRPPTYLNSCGLGNQKPLEKRCRSLTKNFWERVHICTTKPLEKGSQFHQKPKKTFGQGLWERAPKQNLWKRAQNFWKRVLIQHQNLCKRHHKQSVQNPAGIQMAC